MEHKSMNILVSRPILAFTRDTDIPHSVRDLAKTLEELALGHEIRRDASLLFMRQAQNLCEREDLAEAFFTQLERN